MKKSLPILLLLLLLATAIAFQVFGEASRRKDMIAPDIGDLIPKEIPGWTVEDRPIAESPDLQKSVEEILNYDSAVFRIYRKGGKEIAVYMAYWLPGKIDPTLIDGHTPDICWVANGWTMKTLPALPSEKIGQVEVPIPNHRRFKAQNQELTVLYWHVNGDQFRDSHSVRVSRLSFGATVKRRAMQIWHDITTPIPQQFFVRVSSNGNIVNELNDVPLQACLGVVADAMGGRTFYKNTN